MKQITPFFHIKNHSSVQGEHTVPPWEYTPAAPLPSFEDKEAFRVWCKNPATDHYFFSLYEGVNTHLRISEDNPANQMHGLVVDYDSLVTEADFESIKSRGAADFLPNWVSFTRSGNARAVWLFEQPIFVYSRAAHKAFLERLKKEFKINKLLPGLDEDALYDPGKTFEAGYDWKELSTNRVRPETIQAWLVKAGDRVSFDGENSGVEVPIDRVAEEVNKRFPGRWQGPFDLGMRGVRFWDPTGDCQTGAIVRETGMQCFTGPQGFVTWREIFGHRFVEAFQESRISQATRNVYYDGKNYWIKYEEDDAEWKKEIRDNIALHLKVSVGLKAEKGHGDNMTEVEAALYFIQRNNRVIKAQPYVNQPGGVITKDGGRVLNTSTIRCVPAAEVAPGTPWGTNFPWIGSFMGRDYFATPEQWDHFMAWFQYLYVTSLELRMQKGQSIFIAGPAGCGKTLLSNKIIGSALGGCMDVASFLLGDTNFTSTYFNYPIWSIDDALAKDGRAHAHFSAMVKKVVANQIFEYHAKGKDAASIDWSGRAVITLNDDPESLRILPEPEMSLLDKICLFRCNPERKFQFLSTEEQNRIIDQELPFFLGWLKVWTPPSFCKGGPRFGVKEYHDQVLLDEARRSGKTAEFREILRAFRLSYFIDGKTEPWEGTSTELLQTLSLDPAMEGLLRQVRLTPVQVGRELGKLVALGHSITFKTVKGHKIWVITADDAFNEEPV